MTPVDDQTLIQRAIAATQYAYIPYSNYPVGAALQTPDGEVFTGCNIESAAYPSTICAERTALVKAVSEGRRQFSTIAVVTRNGGSPCGNCRQLMFEFAPHLRVILADLDGKIHGEYDLSDLLPEGFGPSKLGK